LRARGVAALGALGGAAAPIDLDAMLEQWQLGLCACLFGSFCGTLGGQLRMCSLAFVGKTALLLQGGGWAFWIGGQGLNQVAILLAPATVAACVTFSSSLLCNALLAPWVLKERLSLMHGVGVLLLSLGGTAVTWASCGSDPFYTWPQLVELPGRPPFIALGTLAVGAALTLLFASARSGSLGLVSFAYLFALVGATDFLVTKFTLQLLRLQVVEDDLSLLPPSGITSVLSAVMIGLHVSVFGFQVLSVYYRKALQSVPLFLGSGAIMQISLCGVFFNEFNFTPLQATVFFVGVCLVLSGLFVTSRAAPTEDSDIEDEEAEDVCGLPALSKSFESESIAPSDASPTYKMTSSEKTMKNGGSIPIISSGLLSRSNSSFSNVDLIFVGEIQRSTMCFGHSQSGIIPLDRRLPTSFRNKDTGLLRSFSLNFPPGSSRPLLHGGRDEMPRAMTVHEEPIPEEGGAKAFGAKSASVLGTGGLSRILPGVRWHSDPFAMRRADMLAQQKVG